MMAYATAAYAMKKEPTPEELASELDAAKKSHAHANRALTNMAVALSDAMDHCVAHEEAARKTKLEREALLRRGSDEILSLSEKVRDLEKRLKSETERANDLASRQATAEAILDAVSNLPPECEVVRYFSNGSLEWFVLPKEKGANTERKAIGIFDEEATARWFAERWRP